MTEFRYGDQVFWYPYGGRNANDAAHAVVIDERRWGGWSHGGVGDSPEFQRVADFPVLIRVSHESEPRWVHGRELKLVGSDHD